MQQVQEGQEVPDEPMQHQRSPSGPATAVATEPARGILTEALVGSLGRAARPGPVLVEGLAALAVGAGRVVLAHTDQLPGLVRRALAGVAIAFAPAARPRRGGAALSTGVRTSSGGTVPRLCSVGPCYWAGCGVKAAQAVLALRPPIVSPRRSQPGQSGGHTPRVARANQLQLLIPEVGQQLQVCRPAGSCPSPAAWGR